MKSASYVARLEAGFMTRPFVLPESAPRMGRSLRPLTQASSILMMGLNGGTFLTRHPASDICDSDSWQAEDLSCQATIPRLQQRNLKPLTRYHSPCRFPAIPLNLREGS